MIEIKIENEDEFRAYFFNVISEEIEKVKKEAAYGRVLNNKELQEFLGVSSTTIRTFEHLGMPFGKVQSRKFYDAMVCKDWVMNYEK